VLEAKSRYIRGPFVETCDFEKDLKKPIKIV
jgi:hypothetical protein